MMPPGLPPERQKSQREKLVLEYFQSLSHLFEEMAGRYYFKEDDSLLEVSSRRAKELRDQLVLKLSQLDPTNVPSAVQTHFHGSD